MNIFRVLASTPRTRFSENQVSAMFAWLLNPYMDHGLGYEFLLKFLRRINTDEEIINRLKLSITDKNENAEIKVFLEYEVGEAIIDIVLIIDDTYYISIENKIYSAAASNEEQLKIQYECIKREMNEKQKAIIVFLVPDKKATMIETEYNNLSGKELGKNKKIMISWDEIAQDIQNILDEEHRCEISPLNEYMRHTLKAFSAFIKGNFKGYNSEKQKTHKINPKADKGIKSFSEIEKDESITFVGVPRGDTGLKQLDSAEIKTKTFQCTAGEQPNRFWIERKRFLDYVNDAKNG